MKKKIAMITAQTVKNLRERTGAGMMDCKRALSETGGDIDAAIGWLRAKGMASAAKKAGRTVTEGLVCALVNDNAAGLIEVNAETDFVARNDQFQEFVRHLAEIVLRKAGDLDALVAAIYPDTDKKVADQLTELIATIGENIALRRVDRLEIREGVVSKYIHNSLKPDLGRIGVIIGLESQADRKKLGELGKQLAMHIAATNPLSIAREDLDTALVEKERAFLTEQARESGKPEKVIEKMIEGRLRKYYEEVCLLDQLFVIDNETRVSDVLNDFVRETGSAVIIRGFFRYQLGESISQ